ncbi:hypothetical protein K435DRAFT_869128 [Dendrothele bispora CBS 962.96]|uniref:Uncharacterized protein n=1 Tax=Dendrothele bispora (strain CBS 962.96) TaxID=1314807 RepID=A0A4S8L9Y1_DENBC|nr:hypothetical protein K435DRAFT_869128 [Dendrothele bispora CBS 962.96]
MLLDRYVLLGAPGSTTNPGVYSSMQWRPGGFSAPLFPLPIQCLSPEQAHRLYNSLQPWLSENMSRLRNKPNELHQGFFGQPAFDVICAELNNEHNNSLFWAVILGSRGGVFFSAEEAIRSVDSSKPSFKLAFAFSRFEDAVHALASSGRPLPNVVHEYDPTSDGVAAASIRAAFLQPTQPAAIPTPVNDLADNLAQLPSPSPHNNAPSTPTRSRSRMQSPAPATPTPSHRAGPMTPRSARSPVDNLSVNLSPRVNIVVGTTTSIQPTRNWVRYYLTSHGLEPLQVDDVEAELEENDDVDSFVYAVSCRARLLSGRAARFLWDLNESNL